MVLILFYSWFTHIRVVNVLSCKGKIIGWVALNEFIICLTFMASLGMGTRNLGTTSTTASFMQH